jgi:hypothetical protein
VNNTKNFYKNGTKNIINIFANVEMNSLKDLLNLQNKEGAFVKYQKINKAPSFSSLSFLKVPEIIFIHQNQLQQF